MVPGDMYEWSRVIFAKKSKFHDEGGPDTVVSPYNIIIIYHMKSEVVIIRSLHLRHTPNIQK